MGLTSDLAARHLASILLTSNDSELGLPLSISRHKYKSSPIATFFWAKRVTRDWQGRNDPWLSLSEWSLVLPPLQEHTYKVKEYGC